MVYLHATCPTLFWVNMFYLSETLAIFFLIRHLLAPGVPITYRKLISYTRLWGSHLLPWLLWQERFHTAGPRLQLETIDFHKSWQTRSLRTVLGSAEHFQQISLPGFVFTHCSPRPYTCTPRMFRDCSTVKLSLNEYSRHHQVQMSGSR